VWPGGLVESSLRRQRVVPGGPRCISTRPGRGPCDPYLQQKPSRHRSGKTSSRGRRRHGEPSCPGCCWDRSRYLSRLHLQAAGRSREDGSMAVEGSECRARTTVVLDAPCLCVCLWKMVGRTSRGPWSEKLQTLDSRILLLTSRHPRLLQSTRSTFLPRSHACSIAPSSVSHNVGRCFQMRRSINNALAALPHLNLVAA
jgi:hypothetical protein